MNFIYAFYKNCVWSYICWWTHWTSLKNNFESFYLIMHILNLIESLFFVKASSANEKWKIFYFHLNFIDTQLDVFLSFEIERKIKQTNHFFGDKIIKHKVEHIWWSFCKKQISTKREIFSTKLTSNFTSSEIKTLI